MKSLNFIQWYVSGKKSLRTPAPEDFFSSAVPPPPKASLAYVGPKPCSLRRFITTNIIVNRIARPERNLYLGKEGEFVQVVDTCDLAPWHQEAHSSVTNIFSKENPAFDLGSSE